MRRYIYSLILVVPFVVILIAAAAPIPVGEQSGHTDRGISKGQQIFRFDTFGDEQLWTDVLRMHEVVATVDPATALAVGLKVDAEALPDGIVAALRAGQVDLKDPAVTVALLGLNAVVGVKGTVSDAGQLTRLGITCALCHSSVDNSFAPGIGKRLDGWANTDLNVGALVALSPALDDATYQLSLHTPKPPTGSFDPVAAIRGKHLFRNEGLCVTCHQGPQFTDVLSGPTRGEPFLHDPGEVGTDPRYAARTATGKYRTTPLRGLWQHPPYFHDGSAPDLLAVVNHYDKHFGLNLTAAQKADLVEFLKSL